MIDEMLNGLDIAQRKFKASFLRVFINSVRFSIEPIWNCIGGQFSWLRESIKQNFKVWAVLDWIHLEHWGDHFCNSILIRPKKNSKFVAVWACEREVPKNGSKFFPSWLRSWEWSVKKPRRASSIVMPSKWIKFVSFNAFFSGCKQFKNNWHLLEILDVLDVTKLLKHNWTSSKRRNWGNSDSVT